MRKWAIAIQVVFVLGVILGQFIEFPGLLARIWWVVLGGFQIVWTIVRAGRTPKNTFKVAFLAVALGMLFIPFFPAVWAGTFGLNYELVISIYFSVVPLVCLIVHLLEWFAVKEEKEELPEMTEPDQGDFMFIDEED